MRIEEADQETGLKALVRGTIIMYISVARISCCAEGQGMLVGHSFGCAK